MKPDEINDQLHDLTEALFGRSLRGKTILGSFGPPFDTTKANIHNSKAEFQAELDAVTAISENIRGIMDLFFSDKAKSKPDHDEMVLRLRIAFQRSAAQEIDKRQIETANDLALKNVVQSGFYFNSIMVFAEFFGAANERLKELRDQERDFWSVSHRPPNYYARTIALRFARLYAREKCVRPTFGISSQGNHPSTDFGRALEQVFAILGIKASVRNAATWAIDQLTDEDVKPSQNALMGGLFGATSQARSRHEEVANALAKYANAVPKDGK